MLSVQRESRYGSDFFHIYTKLSIQKYFKHLYLNKLMTLTVAGVLVPGARLILEVGLLKRLQVSARYAVPTDRIRIIVSIFNYIKTFHVSRLQFLRTDIKVMTSVFFGYGIKDKTDKCITISTGYRHGHDSRVS